MKNSVLKFGVLSMLLLGVVSCKEKESSDDARIAELEHFVDSLKTVSEADMQANWDQISADYDRKTASANEALANVDEDHRTAYQERITVSTTKYGEFKASLDAKPSGATPPAGSVSASQSLRDRLFGAGKVGDDISFAWVNKDNILSVYQTFFQAYKDNKHDFSREDYDEIKLMYEALDARKNTVEKEGLSSSDNAEIANIKLQFGPMFKVNRIGAKSRENDAAK